MKRVVLASLSVVIGIAAISLFVRFESRRPSVPPPQPAASVTPAVTTAVPVAPAPAAPAETVPITTDVARVPEKARPVETPAQRHARLIAILKELLGRLTRIPPSEEEAEAFAKALFEQSGLLPDDVPAMVDALLLSLSAEGQNANNSNADDLPLRNAFAIEMFLDVLHQNRNAPDGFFKFLNGLTCETLVTSVLEVLDSLTGEAQAYLARVLASDGGMLTAEHEDFLEAMVAMDPPPQGLELLLASYGRTPEEQEFLLDLVDAHGELIKDPRIRAIVIAKALEGVPAEAVADVAQAFLDGASWDVKKETVRNLGALSPDALVGLARIIRWETEVSDLAERAQAKDLLGRLREPLMTAVWDGRFGPEAMRASLVKASQEPNPDDLQAMHIGVMEAEHAPVLDWLLGFQEPSTELGPPPPLSEELRAMTVQRFVTVAPADTIGDRHAQEIRQLLESKSPATFRHAWYAGLMFLRARGADDPLTNSLRRVYQDPNTSAERKAFMEEQTRRFGAGAVQAALGIP